MLHFRDCSTIKVIFLMMMPGWMLKYLKIPVLSPSGMQFMKDLIGHLIKQRQANPAAKHSDFLQYLVDMLNNNEASGKGHNESATTSQREEAEMNAKVFDVTQG